MKIVIPCLVRGAILAGMLLPAVSRAQSPLTWEKVKIEFESANPTLKASRLNIDESKAAEITAYLRPNPDFTFSTDGTQLTPYNGVWRPFSGTQYAPSVSYLHERAHKRELRLSQSKVSTAIAESGYADQERGLIFTLRAAFVSTLQAKALLQNARTNLEYWDRELGIDRRRLAAGDMAQIDVDTLELQRVQFETDYETQLVNLRTNKIQMLMLLDAHTPVDQFDIDGPFDFSDNLQPLEAFHTIALENRPDLKVALQNVDLAKVTHQLAVANGSTDPTFSVWITHNPSFNNPFDNNTIGASISIPLRIFDRNQGEKARTEIDIRRNARLLDAAKAQVFSDVDSAYYTLVQNLALLRPYKARYLKLAIDTRDRKAFAYRNGGASLLDYLDAEKSLRDVRLAYLNLIGAYLTAGAQMNLAVGREVIQ